MLIRLVKSFCIQMCLQRHLLIHQFYCYVVSIRITVISSHYFSVAFLYLHSSHVFYHIYHMLHVHNYVMCLLKNLLIYLLTQLQFRNVQRGRCTNVLWKSVPCCWSSIRESSFSEFSPKPRQTLVCSILRSCYRCSDCADKVGDIITHATVRFGQPV